MSEKMHDTPRTGFPRVGFARTGSRVGVVERVKARAKVAELSRESSANGRFSPTVSDLRYDLVLGRISVAYKQEELVGDRIVPVVPVGARHAKYREYGHEAFRVHQTLRASRARANEMTHKYIEKDMATEEQALIESVSDEEKEEAANVQGSTFNLEQEATEVVTASLNLGREKRIAEKLREPNVLGGDLTLGASAKFDNEGSSPIEAFRTARASIRAQVGVLPNFAEIPFDVFEALTTHPEMVGALSDNATKVVTLQALQEILKIPEIIVSSVVENVSPEGQDEPNLLDLWGRDVIVGYRTTRPGTREMTLAYTFRYKGSPEQRVRRWYEADRKTEFFEVSYEEDTRIITGGAGYIMREAIAA